MKRFFGNIGLILIGVVLMSSSSTILAQDEIEEQAVQISNDRKPIKNMFESIWLIDNQTVLVPIKGTFEFDIQHRFGVVKNGFDDLFGLYAPSNIRLGFGYVLIDKLMLGFGLTKENLTWDFNAKYAILRQSRSGHIPVSVTYYVNAAIDGRKRENFVHNTDRFSYFHQVMIARKITEKLSVQSSINLSHYNAVEAYRTPENEIKPKMNNDHVSFSLLGRFKITEGMAVIANYDQPLSKHLTNNPNPNVAFGIEIATSSHAFQIFLGNYYSLIP